MKIYGPVSSFSQAVISQLGVIATQLSLDELNAIRLTERRSIAALGRVSDWNSRQVSTLATAVQIFTCYIKIALCFGQFLFHLIRIIPAVALLCCIRLVYNLLSS